MSIQEKWLNMSEYAYAPVVGPTLIVTLPLVTFLMLKPTVGIMSSLN